MTPREVLQKLVDYKNAQAEDGNPLGISAVGKYGTTVESYVQSGWGVIQIETSAFTSRGLLPKPPEPDGHVNVPGLREDFKKHSLDLISASTAVEESQCLA